MRIVVPKEWMDAQLDWTHAIVEELSVMLPRDRHGEIIVDTKSHSYVRMAEGRSLIDAGHSYIMFMSKPKKKQPKPRKDNGQLWLFPEYSNRA